MIAAPDLDFAARLDELREQHPELPPLDAELWHTGERWQLIPGGWLLEDVAALVAWAVHLEPSWQAIASVVPDGEATRIRIVGRLLDQPVELIGWTRLLVPGVGGWGLGYVDRATVAALAAEEFALTGGRMRRRTDRPEVAVADVLGVPATEQLPIVDSAPPGDAADIDGAEDEPDGATAAEPAAAPASATTPGRARSRGRGRPPRSSS